MIYREVVVCLGRTFKDPKEKIRKGSGRAIKCPQIPDLAARVRAEGETMQFKPK